MVTKKKSNRLSKTKEKRGSFKVRKLSVVFGTGSIVSLFMGLFKMFAYENYERAEGLVLGKENVNAYVGGDAYNFIINGNYATAYFTLFGALLLASIGIEILIAIKEKQIVKEWQ